MMINNINLRNIKCFSKQGFPLSNLNILTGINGVGKSTLIQSILLVVQSPTNSTIEFNGPLVGIGDYKDLRYVNAPDDSCRITFETEMGDCSWGYEDGRTFKVNETPTHLPQISGSDECIDSLRDNIVYISAERWGPRDNVPLNTQNANPYWLGKHGEFTIPFLSSLSTRTLTDADGKSISTTWDNDPRLHPADIGNLLLSNINAWMGEISPNVNIDAFVIREAVIGYSSFSFSGGNKYKAANVGFGLSYALSIVTALVTARKGSVVILENPEAHLHPSGQSKLGQLMALTALAGVQVIVETHSEHIINGARIKVRKGEIQPDAVNVMYISRDDKSQQSSVEIIKMDDMGIMNNWPVGFLDQQAIDMKILIMGE